MSIPSGSSPSPSYTWSLCGRYMRLSSFWGPPARAPRVEGLDSGSGGTRSSGWMNEKRALHSGHLVSILAHRLMHGRQKRWSHASMRPRRVTSSRQMAHTSP